MATIDTDHWAYIPNYLTNIGFDELLKEIAPLVKSYGGAIYGKPFVAKRLSCKFTDKEDDLKANNKSIATAFNYNVVPSYEWKAGPLVQSIRSKLERDFNDTYSYVLVHLYRSGEDTIGYHADRESLDSTVASISLGAKRKFRFRRIKETKGYETELKLHSGTLLYMKNTCQRTYKHCVPVEKNVQEPRINLTFRKFKD